MKDLTGDGVIGRTYKYDRKFKKNYINELTTYLSVTLIVTTLIWFVLIALNYQPAMNIIERVIAGN